MSQKNLRKRQVAAMPVETVRTRKSSQLSQKKKISQNQNETISTNCSKTYMKTRKSNATQGKEHQKQETEETECNKEFYPEKLKRLFQKKEIVLKPKPAYKLVGGLGSINKRKLRIPKKETTSMEQAIMSTNNIGSSNNTSETDDIDLICLDDSDSLDEEDLMEILTCESPVWWEDPPDEYYDTEPLSIKMNEKHYIIKMKDPSVKCEVVEHVQKEDQGSKNNVSPINIRKDKNFVTRRKKLESLLGNIKNKKINYDMFQNINSQSRCSSPEPKRQKKSSECLVVLDEDILKTLENIKIPIENSAQKVINVKDKGTLQSLESPKESKTSIKPKGLTIKKCDIKQFQPKLNNKKIVTSQKGVQSKEEIEKNSKLFLKSWSEQCGKKVTSNVNTERELNQCETRNQIGNKISGLTIKKLDPNLIIRRIKKRNTKQKGDDNAIYIPNKVTTQNKSYTENPGSDDQVTVYKILSDQDVHDNKDKTIESKTYNTQLNSYYNQCKNLNKTKKETDTKQLVCDKQGVCNNSQMVKSIPVSNNETVKYCLQCSSIFDNDTCNYCAIKSNSDGSRISSKAIIKTDAS